MRIRHLQPGAAWNEAERRAIPFTIVGFFLGGLLAGFGDRLGSGIFLSAILGAGGGFFTALAFLVGYYHRKGVLATLAVACSVASACVVKAVWFQAKAISNRIGVVLLVAMGILTYLGLHRLHLSLSETTVNVYLQQLTAEYHERPKAKWESVTYGVCLVLGAVLLLVILARH